MRNIDIRKWRLSPPPNPYVGHAKGFILEFVMREIQEKGLENKDPNPIL